jgi:hypothetical protein
MFLEARGGSKKSAGDAYEPRAAAVTTGTAQGTVSYLFGHLNSALRTKIFKGRLTPNIHVLGCPRVESWGRLKATCSGSRRARAPRAAGGGSEVLETSGEEHLQTLEPESQVPQVPVEHRTERPGGPQLGRLALV